MIAEGAIPSIERRLDTVIGILVIANVALGSLATGLAISPRPAPAAIVDDAQAAVPRAAAAPVRLAGQVDDARRAGDEVVIRGWAADVGTGEPAIAVVVLVDGTPRVSVRPAEARPDVAIQLNRPGVADCGFTVRVPVGVGDHRKVRLFALGAGGNPAELPIPGVVTPARPDAPRKHRP